MPSFIEYAPSSRVADAPPAGEPDHRGLFYRVIAPSAEASVLEFGAPFVGQWFSNVVTGEPGLLRSQPGREARFDMVILHATLGGCASIGAALRAACGVLLPGGVVALAGANRLRAAAAPSLPGATLPSATAWGYRHAAARAGFSQIELYVAQPQLDEPLHIVSSASASARAFFCYESLARRESNSDRASWLRLLLAKLNLARYFQALYVVVGRKC